MRVEARALNGLLHMLILGALADRPMHGYALIQALNESGGGTFRVTDAAVYPALHRLEHLGFVASSSSRTNGRPHRTFDLTPAGWDKLSDERKRWEEFTAVVGAVVGIPKRSG